MYGNGAMCQQARQWIAANLAESKHKQKYGASSEIFQKVENNLQNAMYLQMFEPAVHKYF